MISPNEQALDFDTLRAEGIRHLERLAGHLWTDFNTHDPGITILEQVCYALTDLAYRIDYAIPDLLAEGDSAAGDGFYGPDTILTTRPVTVMDLRKLLIDVPGIKNAWVEIDTPPADRPDFYYNSDTRTLSFTTRSPRDRSIALKGLYRVAVEFEDILHIGSRSQERDAAWREVVRRLHQNRGLGEDFSVISRLEAQYVQVLAYVEIGSVDSPEQVLLAIYEQLSAHISPGVPAHTLSELLEQGRHIDDIYDGPPLDHGFIDDADLSAAQRRSVLRTSDLIAAIMDAPGVRAVRYVTMAVNADFRAADRPAGPQMQHWSLDLDPTRAPKLDTERSAIVLQRNGLPVTVDAGAVQVLYQTRLSAALDTPVHQPLQPPAGRDRQVGRYYSIQHQFPAAYGIGATGLAARAPARRQAQARQLKAYLLFFDQLLADYFAQLAHVRDLFAFDGAGQQTYFTGVIDDPSLGLDGIRRAGHDERLRTLNTVAEAGQRMATERRNRFLNHLLARFAEQFTDYALLLFGAQADQQKLIADKQAFLRNYVFLSSARGTAYNYLEPDGAARGSGLEQRIRRKLGIDGPDEAFVMIEHILLRPMAGDKAQTAPILTGTAQADPYSLRLTFAFPQAAGRYRDASFRAFVEQTVRDETPAHLSAAVQWLDAAHMTVLRASYAEWLAKRRAYWAGVDFSQENRHEPR